jgi:microsomal dipeptidase-like Zn-dependent dipeptidase
MQGSFVQGRRPSTPKGFGIADHFVDLPGAFRRRGFAEADIAKVLGNNFLRVFEAVWG